VNKALDMRYRGQSVQVTDSYKYLGMWFQSNGSWDKEKKSRIKKAKRRMAVAYMLIRAGKLSVQDGLAVWRGLIRPVLEYGSEIWCSDRNNVWIEAERLQRKMLKRILRCPNRMPADVALGELGLTELRHRRDQLRLGFWNKLLSYKNDTLIRRVYNESRRRHMDEQNKHVWTAYTAKLLRKYGLHDVWADNVYDMQQKSRIKLVIHECAEREWQSRIK